MTESTTDIDRTALRQHIRETIRTADDPPLREDLVSIVAVEYPEAAIEREIDALADAGFVHLLGDGDVASVTLAPNVEVEG